MEILLKYNPYKLETNIQVNGQQIKNATWDKYKHERIQVWVDQLLDLIEEQINDNDFTLIFHGTLLDYEDVLEQVETYNDTKGFKINSVHMEARKTNDKINELCSLFEDIQKGPFDDLREPLLKKNFESALGDEFEVSVIATMSSGKSTLINSFLGKELMPSKNEACTATVSRIKDIDGKEEFSGICKDINNKTLDSCEHLDKIKLEEWNREDVSTIEIEGEIPAINSQNIKLVLVDTPGPNNSKTQEHKAHTFKLIRDSAKPMVMYILNATQLQTNDDNALLSAVSEEMRVDGKQSKDRFLFVVNKMDLFDPENDDIPGALENVKQYLESHGIYNANIYPASSELAKVIRMQQSGEQLTRHQKNTLAKVGDFIEVDEYHFTNYCSLTPSIKKKLALELDALIANDKQSQQALIHTGIPAIEEAINEYLEKYAYTAKLKNAVDTFKKRIEEKELMNIITNTLQQSEEEREQVLTQITQVKHIITNGNKAKEFKDKINSIELNSFKNDELKKLITKVENQLNSFRDKHGQKVAVYEAETIVRKVKDSVENLFLDVKEKLSKILECAVQEQASRYVNEYRSYVESLLQQGVLQEQNYTINATIQMLQTEIPSANELITQYQYTEDVVVDQEWVKNTHKKWYNPFSWFEESGYYRDIKEQRDFVKVDQVITELLDPVRIHFDQNFVAANNYAQEEAEKLKRFFIIQMDTIDKIIKSKILELEKLAGDTRHLENEIAKNKENMSWLQNIIERLNNILDI